MHPMYMYPTKIVKVLKVSCKVIDTTVCFLKKLMKYGIIH